MGPGTPYAHRGQVAYPERPVIAFVGDGAFQMNGMNELITVKRYVDGWPDKRLILCVFNNQDLNQVTWEQRVAGRRPEVHGHPVAARLPYAAYAELLGFKGIYCDDADAVARRLAGGAGRGPSGRARGQGRPEIPPLPPHITKMQAEEMAKAMVKGDPERIGVMEKSLVGKLQEFKERLPGRG